MFGQFTPEMHKAIGEAVDNQVVWDLGSGWLYHSQMLLDLGARRVVAIDKCLKTKSKDPRVTIVEKCFSDVESPHEEIVAFLSWPDNHPLPGLIPLLAVSKTVVYTGRNTDGNSCGWGDLFKHLLRRELLAHVPHPKNSLLVCGEILDEYRPPPPEEFAGITGALLTFEQACLGSEKTASTGFCDPVSVL